ncbi:hypothetical protein M378DRAFT_170303 [Amanita muscaria Koide BX008]|uniref:Uncharacterized protein n=1 Tax=Amanita muscaria (strain Koide BX008) TaxID=946122 RepID=A0A0C2SX07_AMAMK|nr:hypothetical protein M378DRAFT_170303 [Amanita muscaria Koide BX008]
MGFHIRRKEPLSRFAMSSMGLPIHRGWNGYLCQISPRTYTAIVWPISFTKAQSNGSESMVAMSMDMRRMDAISSYIL